MKKTRVFYGWWIVVACFVAMFVGSGTEWYTFSIFFKPLMSDFGWSRGEVSTSVTIYFVVSGLMGPLIGKWTLRYGPRRVMLVGAIVAGAIFVLLSFTNSLPHLWIAYGLSSAGIAALSFVPVTSVLANWFVKKRGIATGIALTGMGFGGMVLAPMTGQIVDTVGWRTGYLSLAVITLVLVIPFCGLLIRRSPQEMGLLPNGLSEGKAPQEGDAHGESPAPMVVWTVRDALRTSTFWIIAFSFFMAGIAASGVAQHQVPLLTDKGFSLVLASAALSVMGLMSIVGKLIFGHLVDRVPCRYVVVLSFALQASGISIVLLNSSTVGLWAFVSVFGLGVGGIPALRPLSVAESFGGPSFPVIFGTLTLLTTVGSAIGPIFAGYAFDATGSYNGAFLGFVATFVVAVAAIFFARPPKRRDGAYPLPETVGEYAERR